MSMKPGDKIPDVTLPAAVPGTSAGGHKSSSTAPAAVPGTSAGGHKSSSTTPATGGKDLSLRSYKGKKLVIYFYPKDNTPGCTQEGQDFRDAYPGFVKAGAEILGVSKDSVRSHENFAAKFGFPFPLLADLDGAACAAFDVIKEKSMYGKKYLGVERSTFLFDARGQLAREWRGVKVKGHADEVLEAVKAL